MAKFYQLIPGFVSMATITVKGGLLEGKAGEEQRYDKSAAAAYLDISVSTLERKIQNRQIDYIKYGTGKTAKVEFEKAALDAYRQQHKRSAKRDKK